MAHGLVEGLDLASRLGFYFDYARGGLRLLASRTSVCWRMNLNLALPKILVRLDFVIECRRRGGGRGLRFSGGCAVCWRVCGQFEGVQ